MTGVMLDTWFYTYLHTKLRRVCILFLQNRSRVEECPVRRENQPEIGGWGGLVDAPT